MSLARVYSRAGVGVTAPLVTVEVHAGGGLARMSMVGLPETAVREAKDRVKAALLNCGYVFPPGHITISLAPADLPKEGSRFDLPIALGILAASAQLDDHNLGEYEFIGELSLGGELNPVKGVLPAAIEACGAGRKLVVPCANGGEAALARGGRQYAAESLLAVVAWLQGREPLPSAQLLFQDDPDSEPLQGCTAKDLSDVWGQEVPRRALEVAAAGGHNILFNGPPGTGKTMLASRLPGILPPLTEQEALVTAAVASVSQVGLDIGRWRVRSFRCPHHTASSAALVGGGSKPRPGEISLAHHGVLFLDELPEFNRNVLEVLREPLESGRIVIARAASYAEFPARFQLVAAMNPCPCGYFGDASGRCHCTAEQVQRYRGRISGPLLDRIDLHVEVARPGLLLQFDKGRLPESSATVRQRVVAARKIQLDRAGLPNAQLSGAGVREHCRLNAGQRQLLEEAAQQTGLSPRACQRILKVARTVADLEAAPTIESGHLAEAIAYRGFDCGKRQGGGRCQRP
jgi:magnesium chelatase family protein